MRTGEVTVVEGWYAQFAEGDLDIWTGAWLPQTHAPQLVEHGEDVEVVGTWYEGARLTWAVPASSDLASIVDLAGRGETFGDEERIEVVVREGFPVDHPEIARWLAAFSLAEAQLVWLQVALEDAPTGEERQAIAKWVADHPDLVDRWLGR